MRSLEAGSRRGFLDSREELEERRSDGAADRGHVQATRLFDKLDQLEKRWQSQKSHQRKVHHHVLHIQASSSEREQPPPEIAPTFSTVGTFDSDQRPLGRSGSFADQRTIGRSGSFTGSRHVGRSDSFNSTVSARSDKAKKKKKKEKAPRIVSMFDRLYQKGKVKSIHRGISIRPQSEPKLNRNKRRQRAAATIQGVFRGRKFRKKLRRLARTAKVIQEWWRDIRLRLFYLRLRGSVVILQSLERRRKALQEYRLRLDAVVAIQSQQRTLVAKQMRKQLAEEREKRIRESNASVLIQDLMMKHVKVLRQQRVECISLMVEETPSDEMEHLNRDDHEAEHQTTPLYQFSNPNPGAKRDVMGTRRVQIPRPLPLDIAQISTRTVRLSHRGDHEASGEVETVIADDMSTARLGSSRTEIQNLPPSPPSVSAALYRAAQYRRRAKLTPQETTRARSSSASRLRDKTPERERSSTPRRYRSIAYEYLPTKKTYFAYDVVKLEKIPVLQRWARRHIQHRRRRRAIVAVQCAWRTYRAHFNLISGCLLKQWSVRVDFHQEETTSNPILRQKVRLLALTNAIRQVNDQCIHQEVLRNAFSFVVSWKTAASIYFGEDQRMAELNRCSIHVACEAHRHPLWESWSRHKKFTLLSKAALMRSFANQCARLSRASVLMQSLKMRRILLNMAREQEAARTIQRFWKQYGQECVEMEYLETARYAAIQLQAWWRMTMCIYTIEIQDMSACSIQATYRGHIRRGYYLSCRRQVVLVQSLFRGQRQRGTLRLKRVSAIRIQTAARGYLVRLTMHNKIYAALAIQDWYRAVALRVCMSKIRLSYSILQCLVQRQAILCRLTEEQSALRLQSWWRMSVCKADFMYNRKSVILLQALQRGNQAQRSYQMCLLSSVRIQAVVRGKQGRLQLSTGLRAVRNLQTWWRKTIQVIRLAKARLCVKALQRIHRGNQGRASYNLLWEARRTAAATRLQAWWRMILASENFTALYLSALDIQRVYRGYQARRVLHTAATQIQKWWRMANSVETYNVVYLSVLDIQRLYRGFEARARLEEMLKAKKSAAAVRLQAWWRMLVAHDTYTELCISAIDIQRLYHGFKARQQCRAIRKELVRSAAVRLQSWWRMSIANEKYKETCGGALEIQRIYRGFKAWKAYQICLAAVDIQRIYRGFRAWKEYQLCLASIDIQRLCRGFKARKDYEISRARRASVNIQRVYRGFKAMQEYQILQKLRMFSASVQVQAWWRMILVEECCTRDHSCALEIQRHYQGFKVRKECQILRELCVFAATVRVQAWWRMILVCRAHDESEQSAMLIQRHYRGFVTRKEYQILLELRLFAASVQVQTWWRMVRSSSAFAEKWQAVLELQRVYRGFKTRDNVNQYARLLDSVFTIQRVFRGRLARVRYAALVDKNVAATVIQLAWDNYRERKATSLYNAIVLVQKVYRGHQVRQRIDPLEAFFSSEGTVCRYLNRCHFSAHRQMQLSSLRIQTRWRREANMRRFLKVQRSTLKLQSWWRGATYRHRRLIQRRTCAAVRIQAWYRMLCALADFEEILVASIIIQALYRGFVVRLEAAKNTVAAETIQSWLRLLKAHKQANAATRIQSWVRSVVREKKASAAIVIQSWWRAIVAKRRARAAVVIQSWRRVMVAMRRMEAAVVIQSWHRRLMKRRINAAIVLQAWFVRIAERRAQMASLVRIQAFWRRTLCVWARAKFRQYLISFQALYRGSVARSRLQSEKEAATAIQTWYQIRKAELYKVAMEAQRCGRREILVSVSTVSMHEIGDENCAADVAKEYQLCSILTFPADKTEVSATIVQTSYRTHACRQAYLKARSSVIKIQNSWRVYSSLERNICTRAVVHDDGIEVERMARPQQVVWLKKLRTLAGILVQSWWRARTQRRRYLLIRQELMERRDMEALISESSKSSNNDFALSESSEFSYNETKKVTFPRPFWLFDPEVVMSLPGSLVSCLDSTQTIDNLCGQKNKRANASATKVQRWWLRQRAIQKSKEMHVVVVPTTSPDPIDGKSLIESDPITRSQVHRQLRRIVSAACTLQTWWRLKLLRIIEERDTSATKIESLVRRTHARRFVLRLRSAIIIQKQHRALSAEADYRRIRKGFAVLRRNWLRYAGQPKFRERIEKRNRAIAVLQRRAKLQFKEKTEAAISIQRHWRLRYGLVCVQRVAKRRFKTKTNAALLLQKNWRMFQAMSAFMRQKRMATCLQSLWRQFRGQVAFRKQRIGFVQLQLLWAETYRFKTDAAICVQRQWRMSSTMVAYHQERYAATQIEKAWRRYSCLLAYTRLHAAIVSVQRLAKARFATRSKYVILLQRSWRMHSKRAQYRKVCHVFSVMRRWAKDRFARKMEAVTLLQKTWRMQRIRRSFRRVVLASTCIQSFQRRTTCQSSYNRMRRGLVGVQAKAKRSFQQKTTAAVTLQRHERMRSLSKKYIVGKRAAIRLQTRWRSFSAWSKYITMFCGICALQAVAKRSYKRKTTSVIRLQSSTRMYFARTIYRLQQLGTILIQRQWRRRMCERRFKSQLNGFSAIQVIGKQQYRKKATSAIMIQGHWRMTTARLSYNQKRSASITLQTRYRGAKCKSAYAVMRPGFTSLQVLAKLWFRIKNTCAVQIQAATRRMLCRKRYQSQLRSLVRVQSAFRGFVQRRNLAVLRWLHSIASTMIASWWRRISYEFKYQNFRCATMVLQTGFRLRRRERAATRLQSWCRCCYAERSYQRARYAAIVIETTVRGFLANCRRRHAAASVIQKSWVASQQRFLVRCLLVLGRAKAAIALQRWWRGILIVRRHRRMLFEAKRRRAERRYRQKKQACDPITMLCNLDFGSGITISNIMPWGAEPTILPVVASYERPTNRGRSHHRASRYHHYRDAKLKLRAAVLIQRQWRQFRRSRAKDFYKRSISAAWIQCVWRGYSARRRYNLMLGNKAAESLQIAWQNIQRRRVETKHVMKIQRAWRRHMGVLKYEDIQIDRQTSCLMIQGAWRRHRERKAFLAAQAMQSKARIAREQNEAARKIQRMWWIAKLRGTIKSRKSSSGRTSLPAMVLQAGVAWILSDPRVLDFALKGNNGGG